MDKKPLILEIIFLTVLIGLLHYGALELYWYWTFWWMDIVMHFLGGLWVGLTALFLVKSTEYKHSNAFFIAIGSAILVGLGWEVFEYVVGNFLTEEMFPDTLYDLVMDVIGGSVAYMYVRSRGLLNKNETV